MGGGVRTAEHPAPEAGAVLHYVQRWLEVSAQFVHAQISRSRHRSVVVSLETPLNLDRYPIAPLVSLGWTNRLPPGGVRRRAVSVGLNVVSARHHASLVHVHFGYRVRDVQGMVRRRGLPWVLSLHGEDATAAVGRDPHLYDGVIEEASAVIVPSHIFKDIAVGLGAPAERVVVVPSGVDTRWFTPSPLPMEPVVTFVGRFVEKKGVDVLLAAWPSVIAAVPGARLQLCGYGPLEPVTGTLPSVEVVRAPDRVAVRQLIRDAQVVVAPSRTAGDGDAESLLLVNLEAAASARPVVSTRHGGIPEYVVDGETGLLVPEGDPDALAQALVSVLEDDALAARLGQAGARWAARFDVSECAGRVDDIYDRVLGGRSPG
jgi:colanic acid/amylovoran biosynthesis glycosyltransferase